MAGKRSKMFISSLFLTLSPAHFFRASSGPDTNWYWSKGRVSRNNTGQPQSWQKGVQKNQQTTTKGRSTREERPATSGMTIFTQDFYIQCQVRHSPPRLCFEIVLLLLQLSHPLCGSPATLCNPMTNFQQSLLSVPKRKIKC